METVRFKAGDVILTEGELGNSAFLVISGSVEIIIGEGAKARTVATLKDGEVFGEMCLIQRGPRSATVKALTDTDCAIMYYDDFMASMREDPQLAMEFLETLVARLRKMNEMMENLDPPRPALANVFRDRPPGVLSVDDETSDGN